MDQAPDGFLEIVYETSGRRSRSASPRSSLQCRRKSGAYAPSDQRPRPCARPAGTCVAGGPGVDAKTAGQGSGRLLRSPLMICSRQPRFRPSRPVSGQPDTKDGTPEEARFSKYSIIEVDVEPHRPERDSRPGSLRPDLDTLEIVGDVASDGRWRKRYQYVGPLVAPSLCAIKRDQQKRGPSPASSSPPRSPASGWSPPSPGPPPRPPWPANSTREQELNPLG